MSNWVSRLLLVPYRVLSVFICLLMMTGALAYYSMDFQLFDADEVRSIRVHLTFPKSTDLVLTSQLMEHKRKALEQLTQVKDVIIINGWNDYNYAQLNRSHFATIELLLEHGAYDGAIANQVSEQVKVVLNGLPALEALQVVQAKNKPPVSTPVKIYLYGNNTNSLAQASINVRKKLSSIASIRNISNPMEDGITELVFNVNQEMAAFYGLQAKEIAELLHLSVTGEKIAKIDTGDEIVDIHLLVHRPSHWQSSSIDHLTLSDGRIIPIEQLGSFEEKLAPDVVRRYQGNRYIQITADIDSAVLSNYKTHRQIERLITQDLLSQDVSFEQLGEFSGSQKSLTSMYQSGLLSLGLCYFILAMLFRSYVQPLIVLLTIPLAYMGVIWGLSLMGRDISLFGLVGIIGLIGIVVNDSLVWVSCYNQLKRSQLKQCKDQSNLSPSENRRLSAVNAVKLRFRPIMLTTFTTVMGLLPVSLSNGAGIAGAMANTVVSGLVTASMLLLIFLPICVVIIDDLIERLQGFQFLPTLKRIVSGSSPIASGSSAQD